MKSPAACRTGPRARAVAERVARRPGRQDRRQSQDDESGLSRHQAQSAALRSDQFRLEPAARHRDRDHRRLWRHGRRRAEAGARGRTPICGWSRRGPTDPSPRRRASPATPGNWSAASMASNAPAPSPTSRCRPSSTASRCASSSSAIELGRPGGPRKLIAGRDIMRSHYEMVVDRSAGLTLGQEVPLGTHGHKFTVVGLMRNEVTSSGDPVGYITLHDAQALQFELAPPAERREAARGRVAGNQRPDQRRHHQGVALRSGRGGRRRAVALETPHDADPGATGKPVDQRRHREVAQAAADDHGAADHRFGGHHRPDRLHADHGQGALDRHAQIRRRAGSDHRRPDRAAGAVDGDIQLLASGWRSCSPSSPIFRAGWCSTSRASPSCSSSRWRSASPPAPSASGSPCKVDPAEALASSG